MPTFSELLDVLKDRNEEIEKLRAALKSYFDDGWCPTCDGNCTNNRFKEPPENCVYEAAYRALTSHNVEG